MGIPNFLLHLKIGKITSTLLYILPLHPSLFQSLLQGIFRILIKEFWAHHFPKGKVQTQELPQSDLDILIKCPSQPHLALLCVKAHHAPVL